MSGRREAALQTAVQEIEAATSSATASGKAAYLAGDASKEQDVIDLFDFTVKTFGTVSLVFCNAGISPPATLIEDSSFADWQAALNTNLSCESGLCVGMYATSDTKELTLHHALLFIATYLCSREAFRKMKDNGGG